VTDISVDDQGAGFRYVITRDQATRDAATANEATHVPSQTFANPDDLTYIVYGRVFDKDGGFRDYETTVVVNNTAPTITDVVVSAPRQINQPVTVTVSANDLAGENDTITYQYSIDQVGGLANLFEWSGTSSTFTFIPTVEGNYVARVVAIDEDGGISAQVTREFAAEDLTLRLSIDGPADGYHGVAGQLRDFRLTAISPESSTFTFTIDWKDGSPLETIANTSSPVLAQHKFPAAGVYHPVVTVSDGVNSLQATIANVEIFELELQSDELAVAASDGGDADDTLVISRAASADRVMIQLNGRDLQGASTEIWVPNGGLRVHSHDGNDLLVLNGADADTAFRVQPQSILLNDESSISIHSDSDTESRWVEGGGGSDQFVIEHGSQVTVSGGSGNDTLSLSNESGSVNNGSGVSSWEVSGTNSGSLIPAWSQSPIGFSGMESLRGSDAAPDHFSVSSNGLLTGRIEGGNGIEDRLAILSESGTVDWSAGTASGVVGGFGGIEIVGGAGGSLVGPNTDAIWNVTGPGSGTVTYGNNQIVPFTGFGSLMGGTGSDSFIVGAEGLLTGISGGAGTDTFDVSAVTSPTVHVGSGSATGSGWVHEVETLIGSGAGATVVAPDLDNNWIVNGLNRGTLTSAGVTTSFSGFGRLTGGSVADLFRFTESGSISGQIAGGMGVNTLSFADRTSAVRLQGAGESSESGSVRQLSSFSQVIVASFVEINVHLGSSSNADQFVGGNSMTSWTIHAIGGTVGSSSFRSYEHLVGGATMDQFTVRAMGSVQSIDGGGGQDTLVAPNSGNVWQITGSGSGSLNGMAFSLMENLTGGSGEDLYQMQTGGIVTGRMNPGGGTNTLSYANRTSSVSVNLSAAIPLATNVSSLVGSFSILIGGSGSDTLIGSSTRSMVIVGGAGNDTITGGSQRDILVGGVGADIIRGGGGQDIVIGGGIAQSTAVSRLGSLLSEWTSSRSYQQRISNLRGETQTGVNGSSYLSATSPIGNTLESDSGVDRLFGEGDLDWLLGSLQDMMPDWTSDLERRDLL
jgi:Ca2+-binding RTX toxin-like protein